MSKRVDEIMSKSLKFIDAKTTLRDAHEQMVQHAVRHLLIQDPGTGRLMGLISDRDVKKYVSPFATAASATDRDKATLKIEVGKVMTKTLITAKADDKLQQVAETMLQKHISAVPVVDADGKALGMVTSTDLLRLLIAML